MAGKPNKIWTPEKKLDPRVIALAHLLFIEQWKASFTSGQIASEWDPERVYRHCLKNATVVVMIDEETMEKNQ